MGFGEIIPAIIGAASGAAGNEASRDANEDAKRARNNLLASWDSIALPDTEKQKLMYELPYLVGELSPLQEQAITMDQSRMEDVSANPELVAKQMQGLEALQQISQEGLTPQERSALSQINRQTAQQQQGRDQAILQNMQERGMGGSGSELIQRLKASQMAADQAGQESEKVGALSAQRKMDALQALAQQAGQVRTQEFGEKSKVAEAADAIAKFNAATRGDVQQRNIGVQNLAQQQNLANKQAVQAQQIALKNQQQEKNKGLEQQQFENAIARQSGKSGLGANLQKLAQDKNQPAIDAGSQWAQIGKGATDVFGSIYGSKK